MNYETITYNSHKIYKVKVDLDIESILKEISINDEYVAITYSTDAFTGKYIRQLYQECYDTLKTVYEIELNKSIITGYQCGWFFRSFPNDNTGNYHMHRILGKQYEDPNNFMLSDYSWTYYLNIPNIVSGVEGHLSFKEGDSEPISFLPEKGYLYSFPSTLPHRPNEAPNSTNRRIVGVANIKFIYEQ
jgi:hypothetical protein